MRLIGVTAIIVIAIVAAVYGLRPTVAAYETVTQLSKGTTKSGDRVKVGGAVVAGSWNKQSNPMKFTIREESDAAGTGPTIKVVYSGAAPNTFGDGVVAIVTGQMDANGVIQASEMITKCPSKYQSAVGAIPVAELSKGATLVGKAGLQTTGYIKPGSIGPANASARFVIAEKPDGTGKVVTVKYAGALPDTIKDSTKVVITGTLESADTFNATAVALSQGQ
jgi:cytochrome c-type biogenesis protein CcmE